MAAVQPFMAETKSNVLCPGRKNGRRIYETNPTTHQLLAYGIVGMKTRFRNLIPRYEKTDQSYLALIALAFAMVTLNKCMTIYG